MEQAPAKQMNTVTLALMVVAMAAPVGVAVAVVPVGGEGDAVSALDAPASLTLIRMGIKD